MKMVKKNRQKHCLESVLKCLTHLEASTTINYTCFYHNSEVNLIKISLTKTVLWKNKQIRIVGLIKTDDFKNTIQV